MVGECLIEKLTQITLKGKKFGGCTPFVGQIDNPFHFALDRHCNVILIEVHCQHKHLPNMSPFRSDFAIQ